MIKGMTERIMDAKVSVRNESGHLNIVNISRANARQALKDMRSCGYEAHPCREVWKNGGFSIWKEKDSYFCQGLSCWGDFKTIKEALEALG